MAPVTPRDAAPLRGELADNRPLTGNHGHEAGALAWRAMRGGKFDGIQALHRQLS
jgi:hypothetical protein